MPNTNNNQGTRARVFLLGDFSHLSVCSYIYYYISRDDEMGQHEKNFRAGSERLLLTTLLPPKKGGGAFLRGGYGECWWGGVCVCVCVRLLEIIVIALWVFPC